MAGQFITLELTPAVASGVNPDVHVQQDKLGNAVNSATFTNTTGFELVSGKPSIPFEFASFHRFDCPTPAGANLLGFNLRLVSTGSAASGDGNISLTGGFLKPQGAPNNWESAAGVAAWTLDTHVPFAQWNNGANNDATVWHGNAPAFSNLTFVLNTTNLSVWSIADGTYTGTAGNAPGILTQLMAYLAANEALRGSVVAGAIPVCFQMYQPWPSPTQSRYQKTYGLDVGAANAFRPLVQINYEIGDSPVTTITSPSDPTTVDEGTSVLFEATSTDTEDGNISGDTNWSSSIDGLFQVGSASFTTDALSIGTHTIFANVFDSDGNVSDSDTITLTINPIAPVVTITAPPDSSEHIEGDNINFVATSIDREDGDISAGIEWSSDLDGALGTGASINVDTLQIGTHVITASSEDSRLLTGFDTITIVVKAGNIGIVHDVTVADAEVVVTRGDAEVIVSQGASEANVDRGDTESVVTQADATLNVDREIEPTIVIDDTQES